MSKNTKSRVIVLKQLTWWSKPERLVVLIVSMVMFAHKSDVVAIQDRTEAMRNDQCGEPSKRGGIVQKLT